MEIQKRFVIGLKHLESSYKIHWIVIFHLLLRAYDAPDWLRIVAWILMTLWLIHICIQKMYFETSLFDFNPPKFLSKEEFDKINSDKDFNKN